MNTSILKKPFLHADRKGLNEFIQDEYFLTCDTPILSADDNNGLDDRTFADMCVV